MRSSASGHVTRSISLVTALAWAAQFFLIQLEPVAMMAGFVPARFAAEVPGLDLIPRFLTPLTATLVHGDLLHLSMNLITFWYCGRIVERVVGGKGLIILYLIGAYASAATHWLVNIGQDQPMIGASGAISAVLGAYAMMFSQSEARAFGPIPAEWVRALWLAAGWAGVQWMIGFAGAASGYSIAIAAHIGGFFAGLLLAKPLLRRRFARA
ncbi:MAG: rhomboid family intramembrane serine protease [Alphaproteobacteria bacterium]|nr:rhomboid family intramembrane serine protease [Alphaproteobacteria bacterium]